MLGVSLIFYARTQDEAEALEPGLTDHWHAAYGIYICGTLEPPFTDDADPNGIHTHGDGVIHIHPVRPSRWPGPVRTPPSACS